MVGESNGGSGGGNEERGGDPWTADVAMVSGGRRGVCWRREGGGGSRMKEITLSGMNVIGRQQLVISPRTSHWSWITPRRGGRKRGRGRTFVPRGCLEVSVELKICGLTGPSSPAGRLCPFPSSHLLSRLRLLTTEPVFFFFFFFGARSLLEKTRRGGKMGRRRERR